MILSISGMKIMIEMGLRLVIISLGTPLSCIVAACEVRLLVIWPYASQYML